MFLKFPQPTWLTDSDKPLHIELQIALDSYLSELDDTKTAMKKLMDYVINVSFSFFKLYS